MRVVGLIPARGGSKGIPDKNIAPCAGKPLLAWTCEAALGSRGLARTILSTDSEAIAVVGRACGVEVPFLRPAALSADETPSIEVMRHALDWLREAGDAPEALALLQPTSPLRTARHIDEAVAILESGNADTVVSVVPVPHRFHPMSVMREEAGVLLPFKGDRTTTRRQDLPALWARNGPAILVARVALIAAGDVYGGRTMGLPMAARDSIDIDESFDLELADRLLGRDGR
ncbi:MAG: acylneuraminate cytidylyltransferase family protein [Betaproteobacteria bacterium]